MKVKQASRFRGSSPVAVSAITLTAMLCIGTAIATATEATSISSPPQAPSVAVPLFIRTAVGTTQLCRRTSSRETTVVADDLQTILTQRMPGFSVSAPRDAEADVLAPSVHLAISEGKPQRVLLATICKNGGVYNFTVSGYLVQPPHPQNGQLPAAPLKVTTGSQGGTLEALESTGPDDWMNIFGEVVTPLIPNVAFLPVANDTNNINERLLHNVPMTWIATPSPAAPLAPGASPVPSPPATRLDECMSSADHMLVVGRTNLTVQGNDVTRAIVAGGSLKWTQPGNISAYYISAGVLLGLFYNPANAEVGSDVFYCKPATVASPSQIFQVGGLNHHIVGHKRTPAIGTDSMAQTRALDLATVDLENQLLCIIHDRVTREKLTAKPDKTLAGLWDALSKDYKDWCTGIFLPTLPDDALVNVPINGIE